MGKEKTNIVNTEATEKGLKKALLRLIPILQEFVKFAQSYCELTNIESTLNDYLREIDKIGKCKSSKANNYLLPSLTKGRSSKENLTGLHESTLSYIKKIRHQDVFHRYESHKHLLSDDQWTAVYLHFQESMPPSEVAKFMKKSKSTVYDLIRRADEEVEKYYKKLRMEKINYLKNKIPE